MLYSQSHGIVVIVIPEHRDEDAASGLEYRGAR